MASGPDLKLNIIADYKSATDGVGKVKDSLETLHQKMLDGKATMEEYSDRLVYQLGLINKNGHTIKSVTKSYELLTNEMEKLRFRFGESSEQFQSVSAVAERYKQRLDALRGAEEKRAKSIELHKKALADAAYEAEKFGKAFTYNERESLDIARQLNEELERQRQNIAAVNAKNADVGFMMVTGDKQGVANYALKEYEATLKQTIIDTGINSEATKAATEAYMNQKAAVEQLTAAQGSHELKLLAVAKNILKFQLLMGPITAAVRGFKNTLSDSMKVAAEAEQVFNKLATVFDGLTDSAKRAASAIASELGVATSTAASALSTVGDLLQAQGMGTSASLSTSSGWVKQFQDIIAFKDINMSLEEFAQNFMSGAAGNLRNFRTFGSIVKESAVQAELAKKGMDKLTGSQLELAKMTTRAEMALRQQANAMGATQREWDTMLSVNRRLSESWKEFKENLGDTLNSVLLPMKSMWGALIDQINKANKAQKEFNAGNRNIKVYDIYNNGEDSASFQRALSKAYNTYGVHAGEGADDGRSLIDAVYEEMVKFGATVATIQHVMGDKLTPEMYKELKVLEERNKKETERLAAIETRRGNIGASTDTYEALTEALKAITGAGGISTPDWASVAGQYAYTEGGDSLYANNVAASMMKAISDALVAIDSSDLEKTWGDVISGALDDLDEGQLREAQVESYRKLFEAAWNQFAEGGYTDEETAKLEEIKRSYKQATAALEEYNKNIQRQNALLSANSTLASVLSGTARTKYESGLTGPQSSKDLNMALNWDIPLLIQDFAKSLRDAGVDLKTVMERSEGYRKALIAEANLKYGMALAAEDAAAREGLKNAVPTTNRDALAAWGMSDRDQLVAKRDELASKHNALWVEYQKEIDALDELTKLEAQKALLDKVNPFSGVQSAWQMGEAAGVGGLMGILADILSQTEAFSELTNIVSTTFVPIFNAIFKPLMPALSAVTSMFDALPWDVFFEVFKIVAEVIVAISTVIKVINAVIKNIFTAVHNILQRILHPITGGDQRPYESLEKIMNEANENLEKIKNSSFKIERNTENDDLKALRELYYNKVIDENQLYTGAKVLQKDIPFEALDNYAANVTYEITNNITINANDDAGMQKVERLLDENGIPLGYTFRGYFY